VDSPVELAGLEQAQAECFTYMITEPLTLSAEALLFRFPSFFFSFKPLLFQPNLLTDRLYTPLHTFTE
jgi:hypothetical protein